MTIQKMSKTKLNETVSVGAIGAGAIAVSFDGKTGKPLSFKDFIKKWQVGNGSKTFKPVKNFQISLKENFDLQDVLSRLSGMEPKGDFGVSDNTTYGVEDDEGNIMKVTVPKNQADEFEAHLAHTLADMKDPGMLGSENKSVSMAELLFKLKDKFTIIDVDFPNIPTDVVYNADKVSSAPSSEFNSDVVPDGFGAEGEQSDELTDTDLGGEILPNDMGGIDDLPPVMNNKTSININDVNSDEDLGGEPDALDNELPPMEGDAEGVEDFVETEDEGSILDKVIGMLKSQADAEKAKAEAEAEKYRAQQAEYSAKAATATIQQEEELAQMELEMKRQKEAQKEAKKLSDIAKFRVSRASVGLNEADANESSIMVRRQIIQLPQIWATTPDDDPRTVSYKNQQRMNANRELQARLRAAVLRERRARELKAEDKNPNPDKNIQQQNAQQQDAGMNGPGNHQQ